MSAFDRIQALRGAPVRAARSTCHRGAAPSSGEASRRRRLACPALGLALAFALQACGGTQPCYPPAGGSCGLTLGEPVAAWDPEIQARRQRSRAEYYAGLASLGAGIAGVGIGAGYAWNGSRFRDEAQVDTQNANILLDKADASDERATVGIGIGVPLILVGAALLFLREDVPKQQKVQLPPPGLLGDGSQPSHTPVQAPGAIQPGQGAASAEAAPATTAGKP